MFIAAAATAVLLAIAVLGSGMGKFTKPEGLVATLAVAGVKREQMTPLGVLEVAGAVGLLAGLFWAPIGIAAAVGLTLYFAGAIIAHVTHSDMEHVSASVGLFLFSVAVLVLRILSA